MTEQEVNQVSQTLTNVYIALQNMNMPMTENNLEMMNVAQKNVKGLIGFLQEKENEIKKNEIDTAVDCANKAIESANKACK
jgi:hypothetical protein